MKYDKKTNLTRDELLNKGFKYNPSFGRLAYKFSVYKAKKESLLDCIISIDDEYRIHIDVYRMTGDVFGPFYYSEYGNFDIVLDVVYDNIQEELNKLHLIKKENENGHELSVDQKRFRTGQRRKKKNRGRSDNAKKRNRSCNGL